MTRLELRASTSLASIFALRMLGLFLILPVFAVHARGLPGGGDATLVGLVLGIYGLTQAVLQIPYGIASDRFGRKPVIIAGLLVFALGSFIAAWAPDITWTIVGRSLQGAGAISAAVTAFIADSTRESQRTKAMAMVGGSIGLTFALSLIVAPLLYASVGMAGMFVLTGVLALAAIGVVKWVVPDAPLGGTPVETVDDAADTASAIAAEAAVAEGAAGASPAGKRAVVLDPDLLRLNLGIFILHATQMAMFVVFPRWLVQDAGLPLPEHWKVYLPVVLVSFLLMVPPLGMAERKGLLKPLFAGSVAVLALVQALLAFHPAGLWPLSLLLLGFFVVFNILEATLPSLVSRLAPTGAKGLALGVYNTTQALGLFAGGALGGWLQQKMGGQAVFVATALACGVWMLLAPGLRRWPAARAKRR